MSLADKARLVPTMWAISCLLLLADKARLVPTMWGRRGFATPLVAGCIKNETDGSWWCVSHPSCYGVGDVELVLHPEVYTVGVSS